MASTRMAFGSILGTITNVADTISNSVNLISQGVDMGNRFVEMAQHDQKERQVIHRVTYRDTLVREASMEIAQSNKEVLAFTQESPENEQLFVQAQSTLLDAFKKFDDPKSAK